MADDGNGGGAATGGAGGAGDNGAGGQGGQTSGAGVTASGGAGGGGGSTSSATGAAASGAGSDGGQGSDGSGSAAGDASDLYTNPEKARAEIERLRNERGAERVAAKAAAAEEARKGLAQDLIKFLDPDSEGEVTVEQVQQKLVEAGARGDAAERRLAIIEAAWEQGIDRTKLGYLEFELGRDAKLKDVAHTAEDFGATLTAAIQARVSADPSLKTPGAVTTTGAEQFAGGGGGEAVTKERFEAMSLQERQKLYLEDRATYDRLVNS